DLPLSRNALGVWLCDWAPLVAMLQNPDLSIAARSACFHASLALSIVKQAQQLRNEHLFTAVGLTGGVFQNRLLTEYTHTLLQAAGFTVYIPEHLPSNDAGISFGQIIEVGNRPSITSKVRS
ncbi:MAG: carbamoyltransferase HypF, partial [Methylococcaceae bacterium]|nr:carbamoyltransferase HypF [Methylococcaceae bacterium]